MGTFSWETFLRPQTFLGGRQKTSELCLPIWSNGTVQIKKSGYSSFNITSSPFLVFAMVPIFLVGLCNSSNFA